MTTRIEEVIAILRPIAAEAIAISETTDDAAKADEMRTTGHALSYLCWLCARRDEVPTPLNWARIALEEYPSAQQERFMQGFTLEQHLHALDRFINEFWASPEATLGGRA